MKNITSIVKALIQTIHKANRQTKMKQAITLIIKPTDACNLRCKHCYHADFGYENNLLPIGDVKKIINLASKHYSLITVLFHGGEPLCAPIEYYQEIVSYANTPQFSHLKFRWLLQTNATLVNEEWASFFKNNDFKIGVSFDGPYNNVLRQKSDIALEGIMLLKDLGLKPSAIATLSSETIGRMAQIYQFFSEKEIDFKFGYVFKSGAATINDYLCIDENEKEKSFQAFYELWAKDTACKINCDDAIKVTQMLLGEQINICVNQSCLSHWLCLNANGDIYPCGRSWTGKYCMGNIKHIQNIDELWDSEAFCELLKESIARRDKCKNCTLFSICKGGCNNDCLLSGSVDTKNKDYCAFQHFCISDIKPFLDDILKNYKLQEDKYNPKLIKIIQSYEKNHTCK